MLPSLVPVLTAAIGLLIVPGAAQTTERKKRALKIYDSQNEAPLITTQGSVRTSKVGEMLAGMIALLGPLIFVTVTPSMELGSFGTFIRAHVIDYYMLMLLYGTLNAIISDDLDKALVSRSATKLHNYARYTSVDKRPSPIRFLTICRFPTVDILLGWIQIGFTVGSIFDGWSFRTLAASNMFYYCFTVWIRRPFFDRGSGKACYYDKAIPMLAIFSFGLLMNIPNLFPRSTGQTPRSGASRVDTVFDRWAVKFVEDKAYGDLLELISILVCVTANLAAIDLTTLAYRYDVSQRSSSDPSLASENSTSNETSRVNLSATEQVSFVATLSSDVMDIHGRRPISSNLVTLPRLSRRQLPAFTASIVCLGIVNIVVMIANTVLPRTFCDTDETGFLRSSTVLTLASACALYSALPLVVISALLASRCWSPCGAKGLWTYSEQWALPDISGASGDEEASQTSTALRVEDKTDPAASPPLI